MTNERLNRREFFELALTGLGGLVLVNLAGCGRDTIRGGGEGSGPKPLLRGVADLLSGRKEVTLYDTNAMALYFGGDLGPKTGVIKVEYIIKNEKLDLKFWHGHGGKEHRFTVLPAHFAELKKLKKVTIETTVVDGHTHKLFIDPVNPRYRVAGAKPVVITV